MNASCLDEKGRFKSCPYRVYTDEHKAILRGQGDFVSRGTQYLSLHRL